MFSVSNPPYHLSAEEPPVVARGMGAPNNDG
jgi:hypothetical protein